MRTPVYLSIALYAALVPAVIVPVNERCVTSISTAYGYITFAGSTSRKGFGPRCQNILEVTSIYASSDVYCKPEERAAGISQLETLCRDGGLELIPRDQLAENLTGDAISRMRTVDFLELPLSEPVDTPVLLSPSHYRSVFRTIVSLPLRSLGSI